MARLAQAAPVHMRQVGELCVAKLTETEVAALARALDKVALDCTFG